MNFAGAAITYGENGIRCGCGKAAHSNLVACAISDEELAALATLLDNPNVTTGPWGTDSHEIHQTSGDINIQWVGETCNVELPDTGAANAALIAAARNALPGLLAEITRLRAENERFRGYIVDAGRIARDRATPAEGRIAELDEMFNG